MRTNEAGQVVESCWKQLPQHYPHVAMDAFIIMPNHVHGIITLLDVGAGLRPALPTTTTIHGLPEIIRAFKAYSSRSVNEIRSTPGKVTWQRNYHDHIIRNEKALNLIRLYIKTNPLLWNVDPDNPLIDPSDSNLNQILMQNCGFEKDDLEFVRNYLEVRQRRKIDGL